MLVYRNATLEKQIIERIIYIFLSYGNNAQKVKENWNQYPTEIDSIRS